MDEYFNARVCDFGLARYFDPMAPGSEGTDLTEYVVTRWYRAPEIILNPGHYGYEQDVWAAGCVFAEMVTREPLFPGTNHVGQLQTIIDGLGGLKEEDLNFPISELCRKYINRMTPIENISLYKTIEGANSIHPFLKFLLGEILQFNPLRRKSAEQCLYHPVFDDIKHLPMKSSGRTFRLMDIAPSPSFRGSTVAPIEESLDDLATLTTTTLRGSALRDLVKKQLIALKERLHARISDHKSWRRGGGNSFSYNGSGISSGSRTRPSSNSSADDATLMSTSLSSMIIVIAIINELINMYKIICLSKTLFYFRFIIRFCFNTVLQCAEIRIIRILESVALGGTDDV